MSLGVVVLVLLEALCHATWNAFVKASDDRLADLAAINPVGAATGLLTIPGTAALLPYCARLACSSRH